jgi:hypothetical protein
MTKYIARCIKLDTYRDISRMVNARRYFIDNRTATWQMGAIYDYEYMIDEAVEFASMLVSEEQQIKE